MPRNKSKTPIDRERRPEYPPIPPPGFYWAKCSDDTPDEWTVVKVFEEPEGGRWVENTVGGRDGYVHEWGPALYPPLNAQPLTRDGADEAQLKCTACAPGHTPGALRKPCGAHGCECWCNR